MNRQHNDLQPFERFSLAMHVSDSSRTTPDSGTPDPRNIHDCETIMKAASEAEAAPSHPVRPGENLDAPANGQGDSTHGSSDITSGQRTALSPNSVTKSDVSSPSLDQAPPAPPPAALWRPRGRPNVGTGNGASQNAPPPPPSTRPRRY